MNKEEVIKLAREAGGVDITSSIWTSWAGTQTTEFLERFAALVAELEREECAKLCERDDSMRWSGAANAIRNRGKE